MKPDFKGTFSYIGILLTACVSAIIIIFGAFLFEDYDVEILLFVLVLMLVMYLIILRENHVNTKFTNENSGSKRKK